MTQTSQNRFDYPSGAVGEPPDIPGDIGGLASQVDARLGTGGAEQVGSTAVLAAIPASRLFNGKLAHTATTYWRYNGAGWAPFHGVPLTDSAATAAAQFPGLTIGNGAVRSTHWYSGGVLNGKVELDWGSTTTLSGGSFIYTPQLLTGTDVPAQALDTGFHHAGSGYLLDVSTGTYLPLMVIVSSGTQLIFRAGSTGTQVTTTAPFTFANGDGLRFGYAVKIA